MTRPHLLVYLALFLPSAASFADADDAALLQIELTRPRDDEAEQKRDHLQLTFPSTARWCWQLQHDYRVFELPDIDGQAASSNGHVHQLSLALIGTDSRWRVRLQPTVATSSNALRHNELQTADLQWHGELFAVIESELNSYWHYGIRADDRLGRYQIYPSMLWQTDLAAHWQLQLGWPDSALRWQISSTWDLHWRVEPSGGEWHVYDESFDQDSSLRYRQWQLGGQLRWQLAGNWQFAAGLAREMRQHVRYRLQDNQLVRQASDDHNVIQISLQGRF